MRRHSFDGTGYALYAPLEQCEDSRTSLELLTVEANGHGLLLYSGPVRELDESDPTDYMVLTLVGGYPQLRINHGSGELLLELNGRNSQDSLKMAQLNDGAWHRVDVIRKGKVSNCCLLICICILGYRRLGD
jgi:hypothetical protein